MSIATWFENIMLARSSGTYLEYRNKLSNPDLIIVDEFGAGSYTQSRRRIMKAFEECFGKSVAFSAQLPLAHWSEVTAALVIVDAIRDRL